MLRLVTAFTLASTAAATSAKMDFLPMGHLRTDPIVTQNCLSDHMHTFYGANVDPHPGLTYEDLRAAKTNSGTIVENKSLYWHPSIYMYDRNKKTYHLAELSFGTAYYVWQTGQPKAFPNGFKMIAYSVDAESNVQFECSGPSACERDNCDSDAPAGTFPKTACNELEMKIIFPTCWDGKNLDSPDHKSHVSYDTEGGWFDADCPASHPVKLPEIHFYFRMTDYLGGDYRFSDDSYDVHADYMSGWDAKELQKVLDNCENLSDAAMPFAWCGGECRYDNEKMACQGGKTTPHLTYVDAPKVYVVDSEVDPVEKYKKLGVVTGVDYTKIAPEKITGLTKLHRGQCTGTVNLKQPATGATVVSTTVPSGTKKQGTKVTKADTCKNLKKAKCRKSTECKGKTVKGKFVCQSKCTGKKMRMCKNTAGCSWSKKKCLAAPPAPKCTKLRAKKCRSTIGCKYNKNLKPKCQLQSV